MDQGTIVTLFGGAISVLFGTNVSVVLWCKQRYEALEKQLADANKDYDDQRELMQTRIGKLEVDAALLNACPKRDCPARGRNRGVEMKG